MGRKGLKRLFTRDRQAIAAAGVGPVIPHGAVLDAAIVPEGDRVLAPAEAALEQRVLHVLVEIAEDAVALVARHAHKRAGEATVDVEALLASHRVRTNDRMDRARVLFLLGDVRVLVEAAIDG